jgi:hypothetical protein
VGPQGGARLGSGVRGSSKSRVDGEGGAEAVARRCSEGVVEFGGRGGWWGGPTAGGGNEGGEGPPGRGERVARVKITVVGGAWQRRWLMRKRMGEERERAMREAVMPILKGSAAWSRGEGEEWEGGQHGSPVATARGRQACVRA